MKIENAYQRLHSLWGWIDRQHNARIARCLEPASHVLDIGCGYGSLVDYLRVAGHDAEGIDMDAESVMIAQQLFPLANIQLTNAEHLETYVAGSFDAVILKDALHHIVWENDSVRVFEHIRRILRPSGKLVILDPNPSIVVRTARKLIRHVDPEVNLDLARSTLRQMGFEPGYTEFYEVIGLPLSGGYVGVQLVPNIRVLNAAVAGINDGLSRMLNALRLGQFICWRYVIAATVRPAP